MSAPNLIGVYTEDGEQLADIGYRPWNPALEEDGYLFLA